MYLIFFAFDLDLKEHPAFGREKRGPQMHALRMSRRNHATQLFAIQNNVKTLSRLWLARKKFMRHALNSSASTA